MALSQITSTFGVKLKLFRTMTYAWLSNTDIYQSNGLPKFLISQVSLSYLSKL